MGNGLPYAVGGGGRLSRAGRWSASVGDGGFTMMMGELATLVKYKLPVKVIIIKNNTLGQIKWEQMVFEGNPRVRRRPAADRLRRVRRGCGAAGFTRRRPGQGRATHWREAFAAPGPAVVEAWSIPTSRRCPAMPRWSRLALRQVPDPRREVSLRTSSRPCCEDKIREVV